MFKFNPFTGELDIGGSGGAVGSPNIPQYDNTDPVSPTNEDAWVLHTSPDTGAIGEPIGLLLSLTRAEVSGDHTYQFSYFTNQNTIKRVLIS